MNAYAGPDRREHVQLTDEQIDQIVTRAADKAAVRAVEMLTQAAYQEVGRKAVGFTSWIAGMGILALLGWLITHDKIKF